MYHFTEKKSKTEVDILSGQSKEGNTTPLNFIPDLDEVVAGPSRSSFSSAGCSWAACASPWPSCATFPSLFRSASVLTWRSAWTRLSSPQSSTVRARVFETTWAARRAPWAHDRKKRSGWHLVQLTWTRFWERDAEILDLTTKWELLIVSTGGNLLVLCDVRFDDDYVQRNRGKCQSSWRKKTISFIYNQGYFVAFVIGAVLADLSVTLIVHLELSSSRTSVGWKTTKCDAN